MNKNEEKTKLQDPDVLSADADVQADVDSVMRKYDRESNTRIWEGKPKIAITVILAAFSLWCIYVTLFATFLEEIRLTSFMGLIILMGFLIYPSKKGDQKVNHMPISDIIFMIVGVGSFFYFTFNVNQIINQGTRFTWFQIVIGILAILALIEVTRRCVGLPILIVAGVFIVYALAYGLTNPEFFGRLRYLVRNLFYTKEGIFSTPVNVCSKYIVVFIIFGAFLERTGISNFFIDLANCIAGRFAGGPAKVSVISSALCGMVSGSSVGNTVTTGSVTIPMMKKTGYKPEFAGAVEATSSTGGQIMPPIMGAAAFLMADFVGVPYSSIIGRAILPAILYFAGIISGTITMTGLANDIINAIVSVAGDRLIIALILTMLCCIVLGMGVPTTANYCIMAATTAPILIRMGVPVMAAHFFVFYFGIVADITPPVALAAYAGSAIAKSNPMKTAFNASKLAVAAFIVPYMFCFNPAMLLIDTTAIQVVQIAITAFIGIFALAAALEGYCFANMNAVIRIVIAAGGLLLIHPALTTDLVGLVIVFASLGFQYVLSKKRKAAAQ